MSIPLTINGAVFEYPVDFDESWGVDATGWAQAVTNGMLQMAGGSFPLTADINFGPNFGLLSKYFETRSSTPATTGTVRLSSADAGIAWRNFTNTGNNILTTDGANNLQYNGATISGGVNAGTQFQLGYYATTGSAISGLTLITANRALVSNASGLPIASATTATEIGFVSGVTSAIQTQINAKGSGTVTSVSGTANQITSTGGTTPVLAIASPLTLPGAMTAGGAIAMAANKITGLANGTVSTDAAAFGQVKYLQAVQATTTTVTSTTNSTFQAATNFAVTITPTSASNRVKVTVSAAYVLGTASSYVCLTIKRGSTELSGQTAGFAQIRGATNETSCSFSYIDSPATTSATTYQVFVRSSDNTGNVSVGSGTALCTIIAEEIV